MEAHESQQERLMEAYDMYADAIFRHCYFRVSDREVAVDLMQETFTRTWRALADGKEIAHMRAFLYRTATNLITDHYRKHKTESLDALSEHGFTAQDEGPGNNTETEAEYNEVLRMLARLPEKDRAVVVMRYIDDLSPQEIAEVTGEKAGAISTRITRAIAKARDQLT